MVGKRKIRGQLTEKASTDSGSTELESENQNDSNSKRTKISHSSNKSNKQNNEHSAANKTKSNSATKKPLLKVDKNRMSPEGNSKESKVVLDKVDSDFQTDPGTLQHDKDMSDPFLIQLSKNGFKKTHNTCYTSDTDRNRNVCSVNNNNSLIHMLEKCSLGVKNRIQFQKSVYSPVVDLMKSLDLYRTASPFTRRVTALEWHPTKPNILAVGSKGGDILLWDTESLNTEKLILGIGAAGSCQAIKFWPWDTDKVVTASINGTVALHNFELKSRTVLADTMNSHDHWYCSLDVNPSRYIVAAGRNLGMLHLMSSEGRKVFECKLHKNKITHVEFSPREEWLLCTASTDNTVQLWDIRCIKDRKSALHKLVHNKAVNSAYFSSTDGCRLLTTDQGTGIRVYRAPFWHLETEIVHPHRFFQHISPFKASWHPLQDLIVCGRYPDPKCPGSTGTELRTIDIFEAENGNIVHQLYSSGSAGLCPVNRFNPQGDALASGMGFHVLLWIRKELIDRKQDMLKEKMMAQMSPSSASLQGRGRRIMTTGRGIAPPSSSSNLASDPSRSRPRPRVNRNADEDTDDLKKKAKSKTNVKTKKK